MQIAEPIAPGDSRREGLLDVEDARPVGAVLAQVFGNGRRRVWKQARAQLTFGLRIELHGRDWIVELFWINAGLDGLAAGEVVGQANVNHRAANERFLRHEFELQDVLIGVELLAA